MAYGETYEQFVEKFKPKKTTDDCMTPPEIYEVVCDYVCNRWDISPTRVVRPFWPGENYETYDYSKDSVVIDNPPFSILSRIIKFYLKENIPFFLFCPSLTALSGGTDCNHIICDLEIAYDNGAVVHTSFVTSFGFPNVMESCPELTRLVNNKMDEILKAKRQAIPKYDYPDELVTAAMVKRYAKYGIHFSIARDECLLVRSLDAQKAVGKVIYGTGLLLSKGKAREKAAAEQAVAKQAAAKQAAATTWELSEREKMLVASLGSERKIHP